jgi:hypothetical protein
LPAKETHGSSLARFAGTLAFTEQSLRLSLYLPDFFVIGMALAQAFYCFQ